MTMTDDAGAIDYALRCLREQLPAGLTYHSLKHTEEDVMPAALRLAQLYLVNLEEMHLLQVAAAYHDVGFIESWIDHELAGMRIAAEVLPGFGFTPEQIERISNMILATRLPQSPANLLEEILADADLDVLGREDFFERSEALRQELSGRGEAINRRDWMRRQLGFLQGHTYFTQAARNLRDGGKLRNINMVEDELKKAGMSFSSSGQTAGSK